MSLETKPIGTSYAHEVLGLRLWEPVSPQVIAEIRALWAKHGVLVFRRQALSEAELVQFGNLFGPMERSVRTEWAASVPEISLISNLRDGQSRPIGGLGDGELHWHSDQSYILQPATGAMLYAVELPPEGGVTSWLNLRSAYAGLPDKLKRAVEGRRGVFSYAKRLAGYDAGSKAMSAEALAKVPPVLHPLVHTDPLSGDKALYIDPTTLVGIQGMEQPEATRLLDELYQEAIKPDYVYNHQWQIGDLLVWDNGCTLHRRDPFDARSRRLMKRTTIFLPPESHSVPGGEFASAA